MKKGILGFVFTTLLLVPSISHSYIGARLGVVDEDKFGYSLIFGANVWKGFGLDGALTGFWDSQTSAIGDFTNYWIQGDVDVSYDFNSLLKDRGYLKKVHPYLRGGFTYAGYLLTSDAVDNMEASYGPGFNFGGGVDWALLSWLAVGLDVSESIVYLNGVTVSGVTFPDSTAKVFSAMGGVKFFVY